MKPSPASPRLPLAAFVIALCAPAAFADDRDGAALYKQMCLRCHGAAGEGTEEYPRPLAGSKSVAQLAKLIARTMPEDDPGTCVGEEADKVAAYIHGAFYSELAKARNKPARVELSRLTVRQYRNALADLIGSFRGELPRPGAERGLKAEYFKGRGFRGNEKVITRTDPQVAFDFGTNTPEADAEKFPDPHQFSIRWEGSVVPPETGLYEFVVKTEHATRLWVNDQNRPLIDAWVKSGNDEEFRGSAFLLGGRPYPLRLEFSKAKQGVDDSQKNKERPVLPASIRLAWLPPGRAAEAVPDRCLIPGRVPETFVITTPFPPDDRSIGYERGTAVSKEWDRATTEAALETADYVMPRLRELFGAKEGDGDRAEKLRKAAKTLADRAFRRPLGDDEAKLYIDRVFNEASDPSVAFRRALLLILKSPRFLYREVRGSGDPFDVAARLSFGLWDSIPDPALRQAAEKGELKSPDQVARQAERMLGDWRSRSKMHDFLMAWLKVEQPPDLGKDPERYPGFDRAISADLRTSLELFLDDVVWGDDPDFRRFLLADEVYLNGPLARFYGADLPENAPFQKVKLDAADRAGVLSHPYLMATFSYTGGTSPIHRGVFIARGVLGQTLRPPPEAVAPLAPDLHPNLTTRERVTMQTSPQACMTCHGMINPLGFPLEQFDAIGRYRKDEQARPIDATGSYQARDGKTVSFRGARELAAFLAGSDEVHEAFVEQLFHDLVKQPVRAYGSDLFGDLTRSFSANGFQIRKLMVEILSKTATVARPDNPVAMNPDLAR
ncbi:MAG: DUF1592 domain-containing protein [Isosphaeraceae bacterium]